MELDEISYDFYDRFPSLRGRETIMNPFGSMNINIVGNTNDVKMFTDDTIEMECLDKEIVKEVLFKNIHCRELYIDICEQLGIIVDDKK